MTIHKSTATVTKLTDLSPTAREVTLALSIPLGFVPGAFINIFIEKDGTVLRRAYSIASSDASQDEVTIAVRRVPGGAVGELFWDNTMLGKTFEIMGPLGLNTLDKMDQKRVFLCGFGIGAGVVKSLALSLRNDASRKAVTILTGSKTEEEVLFEDIFKKLAREDARFNFMPVVSRDTTKHRKGYIQDNIGAYDFTDADVFICGQEAACNELAEKIKATGASNTCFFIEGFH